jgi:hypothetical protein
MAEGGEIRAVAKGIAEGVAKGMEDSTAATEKVTTEAADKVADSVAEHQANDAGVRDRLHAAVTRQPAKTAPSAQPATAAEQIRNGQRYTGRKLPQQGGPPGGTLYKQDPQTGQITNYTTYDADGNAIKRVDLTGRPHGGVPTPHVVEYDTNFNPNTGQIFVRQQRHVRPATPDEIP